MRVSSVGKKKVKTVKSLNKNISYFLTFSVPTETKNKKNKKTTTTLKISQNCWRLRTVLTHWGGGCAGAVGTGWRFRIVSGDWAGSEVTGVNVRVEMIR